ncbi:TPA: molecular chaperone DnaJ [Candidatus Falkowbacteria bacterium]|nr:molecular chaperone DnaJ [Candidatus Falkowbacteria bacterium]
MAKDYYKILGVEKNASQEEIKKAFRKKAHEFHPDKPTGDEAKFKEVNEAYQILGNEEKRKQFDQFGDAAFSGQGFGGTGMNWDDFRRQARQGGGGAQNVNFDFGDLGDIFGDIFGFGGSRRGASRAQHGADIQMTLNLEFKEAVFGVKKDIRVSRHVKCSHCHGNMAEPGTPIKTCGTCGGAGQVIQMRRTMLGQFQTASACPECGGEGKLVETKCSVCFGVGVVQDDSRLDVSIPAGVESGMTLRVPGQAHAGINGGQPGDIYLQLRVKKDLRFTRDGFDIFVEKNISMVQAALGSSIEVETLEEPIELKIPAGTQPDSKFRLKSKGVPKMNTGGRGEMYVVIKVEVPKRLSRKQKKILEEFDE